MMIKLQTLAIAATAVLTARAQNASNTMQRIAFYGEPLNVTLESSYPIPTLEHPADALVRITKTALCGSDLHYTRGFLPPQTANNSADGSSGGIGHEAIGYIESIGPGVFTHAIGDYVVFPATPRDGAIEMAPAPAGRSNPLQAEYAVVPFADTNLIPVPITRSTTTETLERDYLLVGDVWPTSWQALDWANFQAGDTVAIWGAGPVGLLAAYSAKIRGASHIYVIDRIEQRLERAASLGPLVTTVNLGNQSVVDTLLAYEPEGIMRLLDCVGFEATDADLNFDPDLIWNEMLAVAHYGAGIGLGGVWTFDPEEGGVNAGLISGNVSFPYAQMFSNRVSIFGGLVEPLNTAGVLVDLVKRGVAKEPSPSELITTADIGFDQAVEYYGRFERWEEIKVYITIP